MIPWHLLIPRAGPSVGDASAEPAIPFDLLESPLVLPPVSWECGFVIVADGSAGMLAPSGHGPTRTKAAMVANVCEHAVRCLHATVRTRYLALGFVAFNDDVTIDRPIVPVADVSAGDGFDPTAGGIGGTRIWAGLEGARAQILNWRGAPGRAPRLSNVVLTISDGGCSQPDRTVAVAASLREIPNVTVAACVVPGRPEATRGLELMGHLTSHPRLLFRMA